MTFLLQEWGLRLKCVSTPLEGDLCLSQGADKLRVCPAATSQLDGAAVLFVQGEGAAQGTAPGPLDLSLCPLLKDPAVLWGRLALCCRMFLVCILGQILD